jgi:hypothetical protein
MLSIIALLSGAVCPPALADVARSEAILADRTICWWSGWDSEQYLRDHTYVYSYHVSNWYTHQVVIRGVWALERDGTVTLTMEDGVKLTRKYDVNGNRVVELTGTLSGGAEGYFC